MQTLVERGCGLDVHQATVVACLLIVLKNGEGAEAGEGTRFVRGGRYGISIDFGLEMIEKKSACSTIFKSKFIDPTIKPGMFPRKC